VVPSLLADSQKKCTGTNIKSLTESQLNAMDVLSAKLEKETNNNLATSGRGLVN